MKRLIVLTLLLLIATSSSGCCRRGSGLWGLRGASCGAPMAPTYTPVPAYAPPAYAPPAYPCPPSTIQEVPCDPCSTYGGYGSAGYGASFGSASMIGDPYSGSTYEGGTVYGEGAASYPPSLPGPIQTSPIESGLLPRSHASHPALGVPMYSHTIGDRKLLPGETLNREVALPMESAAAKESKETK